MEEKSKYEYDEGNCPFKEGEKILCVNIRFPGNAKAQTFLVENHKLNYKEQVLAPSDRGVTVGYVNSLPFEVVFNKKLLPLKKIIRIATDEDIQQQKNSYDAEKRAENICLHYIQKYQLDMTLTHVEIIQFGKKAVFYFTAPDRVDFRELVKSLVSELKMRIELRQITVRDRSAAIGAIGMCGRQCCCSSFLKNYGNVTIKMVKNQNITVLPSRINGICGQIKCCMRFEEEVYSEKRKRLPSDSNNSFIKTVNGDCGKVLRLRILEEEFEMLTDQGKKRRYSVSEYDPKLRLPEGWRFPDSFDNIVDETSELIGTPLKEIRKSCDNCISCPKKYQTVYDSDKENKEETEDATSQIEAETSIPVATENIGDVNNKRERRDHRPRNNNKRRFPNKNHHPKNNKPNA